MKRTIVFIGFNDHPRSAAVPDVGSVLRHDPACGGGRIQARGGQYVYDHRRCGRLAVGARHGDASCPAHQYAEQFGAADRTHAKPTGRFEFGIVLRNGGREQARMLSARRVHDQVRPRRIARVVAVEDGRSETAEPVRQLRSPQVRSAHFVSKFEHQFSQTAHSDSAYADEMRVTACNVRILPISHIAVSGTGTSFWKRSAVSRCSSCRKAARTRHSSEREAEAPWWAGGPSPRRCSPARAV